MPKRTREEAAATRAALVKVGRRLFAQQGFEAVSGEALAAAAGVTRGALNHHFDGKHGLFRAVVSECMRELAEGIASAAEPALDPLEALERGVVAFVENAVRPAYLRILLIDGPAVLGWQQWRAIDLEHGLGLMRRALLAAEKSGRLSVPNADAASHLLAGALVDAAMLVAARPRDKKLRADVAATLRTLVRGLAR